VTGTSVVETAVELRDLLHRARDQGAQVGLVPTMGALHAGHRALIERAAAETELVVVSIFVNPLQFDDPADLQAYPRTLAADVAVASAAGAQVVFIPAVEELYPGYPSSPTTTVHVAGVTEGYEGAARPGHFDGVATVVTKLFVLVGPCRAYFGRKDAQQLALVRRLAAELLLPVEVVACPTVREPDGLALSSRNVRLAHDDRRAATCLYRALQAGARCLADGATLRADVQQAMLAVLASEPRVEVDYADVVDPSTFRPVAEPAGAVELVVAARVGPVRLIDALPVTVAGPVASPEAVGRSTVASAPGQTDRPVPSWPAAAQSSRAAQRPSSVPQTSSLSGPVPH